MPRPLRFVPENDTLVEITTRCFQSQYLLTPSPLVNEIICGVLARAANEHQVGVVAYCFMSSHYHLLVRVHDAEQLARFAGYLNSNVAREINRLRGRRGHFWEGRYHSIVVSGEEAAQIDRLVYTLSNGCKEGLVERLADWPGVHAAQALLDGGPVAGTWFDRTREYGARRRREACEARSFAETQVLELVPLPCWEGLPAEIRRSTIAGLVQQIEAEAAAIRKASGIEPLGREAIERQNPSERPKNPKKSSAPRFHAFTKKVRRGLYQAYASFVAAFREAAEKLRAGDRMATFPTGSFPPHLPFVRDDSPVLLPTG
jgi:REP element-mobilizing transposase RayT